MFDSNKFVVDVEMAAYRATQAAGRVRQYKDEQRGEDSVGRLVMAGADELYVGLHDAAEKLKAALDDLAKARTEAAIANGEEGWSVGVGGGQPPLIVM